MGNVSGKRTEEKGRNDVLKDTLSQKLSVLDPSVQRVAHSLDELPPVMNNERQTPRPLLDLLREPHEWQTEVDELTLRQCMTEERVHRIVFRLFFPLQHLPPIPHSVEVNPHVGHFVDARLEAELLALDERLAHPLRDLLFDGEVGRRAKLLLRFLLRGGRGGVAEGAESGGAFALSRTLAGAGGLTLGHRSGESGDEGGGSGRA
jgi:hypothetical protein